MEIINYFPTKIKIVLEEFSKYYTNLNEIRIRIGCPIILKIGQDEKILNYKVSSEEISEIMQNICENSIYSYQLQMCEGYITVNGGHRVGISGNVVIKDEKIININYIYSLNFRIAKQIKGCSNLIFKQIVHRDKIGNTLIVSPPGLGKTTILRDLARNISDGMQEINFNGVDVSIIDERSEIAAMHKGVPQNDVGIRTDVINNVKKSIGIKMAVRSLAPKVIIADEIGNKNDADAINYAICSGVTGIFSAHGKNIEDLKKNLEINELLSKEIFNNIVFLDEHTKGRIREIWTREPTPCSTTKE